MWTDGSKTELTGNGRQRSTYVCHVDHSYPFSPFAAVFSGAMSDLEFSVAAPSAKRIRRRQSVRCGHCDRLVPAYTYYRHREQFYDVVSQQWQQHAEHAEHLSVQNSSHEQEEISGQGEGKVSLIRLGLGSVGLIVATPH